MKVSLNTIAFEKQMNNLIDYSVGFIDGTKMGKKIFLDNLGRGTIRALELYIDAAARSNPTALHHVYEWYKTGSPSARLFDLKSTVTGSGLSINSSFKQSNTLSQNSTTPFYNKAKVMENGIPVKIRPKKSEILAFDVNGETVFTKSEVDVQNPGGNNVVGSFEKIVDEFFNFYFTQAFLRSSGLTDYLENPEVYKKNIKEGLRIGRSSGVNTGFKWISNAQIGIE